MQSLPSFPSSYLFLQCIFSYETEWKEGGLICGAPLVLSWQPCAILVLDVIHFYTAIIPLLLIHKYIFLSA